MDSGNYTLDQLLGEDELLQELRGMHPQLVDFFGKEGAVQKLVEHVIMLEDKPSKSMDVEASTSEDDSQSDPSPQDSTDDNKKGAPSSEKEKELQTIRYPYMACEVICCEINSIIDALVEGHVEGANIPQPEEGSDPRPRPILDLLFSVLYTTPSGKLDDYRAGYLDKILSVLCRKRPQAMSVYLNETCGGLKLMKAMLEHLYSHSILQIVQRLLLPNPASFRTTDTEEWEDDEAPENMFRCKWSESPEAIACLLDALLKTRATDGDAELRLYEAQNASEVLITVIQNSPLTSATMLTLTSDEIMERITNKSSQLEDGEDFIPHDSTLTCTMNVLESIVLQLGGYGSVGTMVEEDDDRQDIATADSLVKHLPLTLKRLGDLLRHPSTAHWKSPMQFSKNEDHPILGTSRLRIARLIESLVLLGNADIDQIMCESNCLDTCLDLFWKFEWCSMLHQSVANLLVHVFEGANARAGLQEFFLVKCNLMSLLMESFEDVEDQVEDYEEILRRRARENMVRVMRKELSVESIATSDDGISIDSEGAVPGEQAPERLPISDDDVDAALEQQEEATQPIDIQNTDADDTNNMITTVVTLKGAPSNRSIDGDSRSILSESVDAPTHIPALRKGYMGHVIIICQALVHACSAAGEQSTNPTNQKQDSYASQSSEDVNGESPADDDVKGDSELPPTKAGSRSPDEDDESYEDSESPPSSPLVIAHLIHNHPLREQWHEFVTTTLAAETAIQSTPLGGFNANSMLVDPMHTHRTGQHDMSDYHDDDDDDDDDDDERGPGRGLTSSGDALDMDDNDIEIAASMMEALNMPSRNNAGSDGDDESGEDSRSKPGFRAANEYMFDDPLGGNRQFGHYGNDDDSSDDEEENSAGLEMRRSSSSGAEDPPVMDLFAGNFSGENGGFNEPQSGGAVFGDFANFDDAFAAAGAVVPDPFAAGDPFAAEFPAPAAPPIPFAESAAPADDDIFGSTEKAMDTIDIDEIFGSAPHPLLLDEAIDGKQKSRAQEDDEDPGATKPMEPLVAKSSRVDDFTEETQESETEQQPAEEYSSSEEESEAVDAGELVASVGEANAAEAVEAKAQTEEAS